MDKIFFILMASLALALHNKKQSSTKRRCDMIDALVQILTPLISPLAFAFQIKTDKPFS